MKNQTIRDERVISQRRKVSSEADGILMFALLASILLQQFVMNAPFKQYAAEFPAFSEFPSTSWYGICHWDWI